MKKKLTRQLFITGYLGEQIVEYVESNYPALKADFIQQEEMLGLGHAIQIAVPTFDHEDIFIILGDTIFDVDLKSVLSVR